MQKTKCDFCQYRVGNECVAADASGKVNEYKCRQAVYEYHKWLKQRQNSSKIYRPNYRR